MPTNEASLSEALPSKEYLANLLGLVQTAQESVESINTCLMTQVLENADQIRESVKNNGKDGIANLVENMLKAPIRKQSGRLKTISVGLREVQQRLQATINQEDNDAKATSPTGIQR